MIDVPLLTSTIIHSSLREERVSKRVDPVDDEVFLLEFVDDSTGVLGANANDSMDVILVFTDDDDDDGSLE